MVKKPKDKIDMDEFDSVDEYIAAAMDEGWTIEADDLAGWECATCGDLIPFEAVRDDRDAVVTWDITVQDPEADEPEGHYARYYFCSKDCRHDAKLDPRNTIDDQEPDMVKEKGMPVIAEDG